MPRDYFGKLSGYNKYWTQCAESAQLTDTSSKLIETRKRCEIFLKLTIKTPERRRWRHSGVFIANFEHTLQLFLVRLLLTLNK